MDFQNRPQGCLSSYPGPCDHPQVLSLRYSWKDLPVLCSPVWSRNSPPRFHQNISTSGTAAPYSGNTSSCLSRQHDYPVRFTRSETLTYSTDHPTVAISRMNYQLEEVYANSLTHPRFLGPTFQSRESHHLSFRLILRFSHQCPIPCVNIHGHACPQDFIHHQSNLALSPFIHHGRLQLRFLQFWIKRHWAQHRQSWDTPLQLNAEFLSQLRWFNKPDVLQGVPLQPVLLHGCISNRIGSQLASSSPLRTVVSSGLFSPYQLAGARGHLISSSSVGTSVSQSDCSRVLRQQYSGNLHTQAGRDTFHISVQQNSGNLSSSGQVWDSSRSDTPSRTPECNRRCPVSTQQYKSNRMETSVRDLAQSVLCLREPPPGIVRHGREPGDSNLHFTLPGRQGLGGRRPLHILGWLRTSIRLPSSSHSPQNSPEDQGLPRHHGDSDRRFDWIRFFLNVAKIEIL